MRAVVAVVVCMLALSPAARADDTPNVAPESLARASLFGGIVDLGQSDDAHLGSELHLLVDVAPADSLHLHAAAPLAFVEGEGWEPGTLAVGALVRTPPLTEGMRQTGTLWLGADLLLAVGDAPVEHDLALPGFGLIGGLDRRVLGRYWMVQRVQLPGRRNYVQSSIAIVPTTDELVVRVNGKGVYPFDTNARFLLGMDYEVILFNDVDEDPAIAYSLGLGWRQLSALLVGTDTSVGLVIGFEQSLGSIRP